MPKANYHLLINVICTCSERNKAMEYENYHKYSRY
uniref:Uncharacterized protein n=1 Tax=Manihot esculenta TaxID=3983 RepID=A0A2C9UHM9_MANES